MTSATEFHQFYSQPIGDLLLKTFQYDPAIVQAATAIAEREEIQQYQLSAGQIAHGILFRLAAGHTTLQYGEGDDSITIDLRDIQNSDALPSQTEAAEAKLNLFGEGDEALKRIVQLRDIAYNLNTGTLEESTPSLLSNVQDRVGALSTSMAALRTHGGENEQIQAAQVAGQRLLNLELLRMQAPESFTEEAKQALQQAKDAIVAGIDGVENVDAAITSLEAQRVADEAALATGMDGVLAKDGLDAGVKRELTRIAGLAMSEGELREKYTQQLEQMAAPEEQQETGTDTPAASTTTTERTPATGTTAATARENNTTSPNTATATNGAPNPAGEVGERADVRAAASHLVNGCRVEIAQHGNSQHITCAGVITIIRDNTTSQHR